MPPHADLPLCACPAKRFQPLLTFRNSSNPRSAHSAASTRLPATPDGGVFPAQAPASTGAFGRLRALKRLGLGPRHGLGVGAGRRDEALV